MVLFYFQLHIIKGSKAKQGYENMEGYMQKRNPNNDDLRIEYKLFGMSDFCFM